MQPYHLHEEFTDPEAERALLAAIVVNPALYFECAEVLTADLFPTEGAIWQQVALAVETQQAPALPTAWPPTPTPQATAQRLADLWQRRLLATAQERLAAALFDPTIPASTLAALLEEEALRVHTALRETVAGRLQWASTLVPQVLADAAARRQHWEVTGSPVQGVPTGIPRLDDLLSGLNDGLYLLGGAPSAFLTKSLDREPSSSYSTAHEATKICTTTHRG